MSSLKEKTATKQTWLPSWPLQGPGQRSSAVAGSENHGACRRQREALPQMMNLLKRDAQSYGSAFFGLLPVEPGTSWMRFKFDLEDYLFSQFLRFDSE